VSVQALRARFEWEARSRVAEDDSGRQIGVVLVASRATPDGALASMDVAGSPAAAPDLIRWAQRFSGAAGAFVVQLFVGGGHGENLTGLGFEKVRPWLRMDRSLGDSLAPVEPVPGYQLIDGTAKPGTWAYMHNRSFADHWRFAPRTEVEMMGGKDARLCLMAISTDGGHPAALTIGLIETYRADPRPQPVGIVSSVGTVPEHRRRGLAKWLVAEVLERLRGAGAKHASLYVDGWNDTGAVDAYRKLGFDLAFEAEVWESKLS